MSIYSNRLGKESSPYLLQHANNPVHWFAWGAEALDAAKKEDKPILVSIGYAACHWCHVMEKESFEKEEVAAVMNKYFINIKIDREERPDLDHIYMDAVQAIAGNGGWPLNVFLTPDTKPFFGGTYFPPQKAFNRPSWLDVLESVNSAWKNKRNDIELQADQLIEHLAKSNDFGRIKNVIALNQNASSFTAETSSQIAVNLLKTADKISGGFGKAPKFPQTFSIQYLLLYAYFFNDTQALQQAELSLQKMLNGGIYDQLGGGLSRYSTDNDWLVPHFEKMLYDNALLLSIVCDAYQFTKKDFYKKAIIKTLDFIMAEMKDEDGGYYSAIDADSEGVEGKFYVWQKKEVDELLGEHSDIYCAYYNITENGNWEEKNILHITEASLKTPEKFKLNEDDFESLIADCNHKLLTARNKRTRPATDDKILLGWNALLLTALCKAYGALGKETYKNAAIELFDFIEKAFVNKASETLCHTYKNEIAKYPAFLDDYAYYIQACISLQEITGNQHYLYKTKTLTEKVLADFKDQESDFLFFTNKDQSDIVLRKIEVYDGATPSANAVMAHNLLYLSIVFDKKDWKTAAQNMILSIADVTVKHPGSFGIWAAAYLKLHIGINEIAITGRTPIPVLKQVLKMYNPFKVLQTANKAEELPLLIDKGFETEATIYLCKDYACQQPVQTASELKVLIKKLNHIT